MIELCLEFVLLASVAVLTPSVRLPLEGYISASLTTFTKFTSRDL